MTLIIFIIIASLLLTNIIAFYNEYHYESYYTSRIKNNKTTPKVYDIGHKYLPNISKYEYILNIILGLAACSFFIYPKIFLPFLVLFLIIIVIRMITIQLTVLPKTTCDIKTSFDLSGYCYDKIFSGHTAFMCLLTLFLYNLKKISVFALIIINVLYGLLIISARSHYTIDVVVAFIVTLLIFQNRKYFFKFLK
jgi:hypothetical protein